MRGARGFLVLATGFADFVAFVAVVAFARDDLVAGLALVSPAGAVLDFFVLGTSSDSSFSSSSSSLLRLDEALEPLLLSLFWDSDSGE